MHVSELGISSGPPPCSSRPCCHLQEASEAAGECVYNVQHKLEAAGADLRRDVAAALADAQEEVVARVRGTLSEAEGRHAARLEGATCSHPGHKLLPGAQLWQNRCHSCFVPEEVPTHSASWACIFCKHRKLAQSSALGVPATCRKTSCSLTL